MFSLTQKEIPMSIQEDWPDGTPKPRGMSTTAKVLLILGGLFGLGCVLCCGGVMYMGARGVSMEPEGVKKVTAEIADIEIPENFTPQQSMNIGMFGSGMKTVIYVDKDHPGSMLMLMQMSVPMGNNPKQQADFEKGFQQGGAQNAHVKKESIELRDFEIRGKSAQFQYIKGTTDDGKSVRQVNGAFSGKGGAAMLMLLVPDEDYDEEAVVKLIESIK